jgi:hypothetical protein
MPIFRAVETFIIVIDFIKLQGYNSADAMSFVTKHCDGQPHLRIVRRVRARLTGQTRL